jgi:hypothetical protein
MKFSQRKGLSPVKSAIQKDSIDGDLRIGLWNLLLILYWNDIKGYSTTHDSGYKILFNAMWHVYFKKPLDTISYDADAVISQIRIYYFSCPWYEVYDFLEFVVNHFDVHNINELFMKKCNNLLERELSAFRFVGGKIVDITSEEEIAAIEGALSNSDVNKQAKEHLKTALQLLSDRKKPDYRNSIKESISAVESICKTISGNDKAILGDALKILEKDRGLHGALKKAFSNLYGYTSDADGIRHALLDEPSLQFEDAKFMLVACSAFVNYLIAKMARQ